MSLDKFKGCILGVAIGDKLGMPVETMTAQDIRNAVGGEVKAYLSPQVNPRPFPEFAGLKESICTDDTDLTMAVMEALIESDGKFDMDVIARRHIEAAKDIRGMGRSTRNAINRLTRGVHWSESGEPESPNGGGAGNGVIMKIAPLGLLRALGTEDVDLPGETITFSRMTHLAAPAIVAAGLHAFSIAMLLDYKSPSLSRLLAYLLSWAKLLEEKLPESSDKISDQVCWISSMYNSGELKQETPETLGIHFGVGNKTSFSAFNSFGLSYSLFVRNPHSFDAVFDAVNAGGDTDTNASIVGSLVGALNGMEVIPTDLIEGLEISGWITERVEKFFELCDKGGALWAMHSS